jgi:hypothetical protein
LCIPPDFLILIQLLIPAKQHPVQPVSFGSISIQSINMKVTFLAALAATLALTSANPLPVPTPPNIPSATTAKAELAALGTRTTDATGYSRDYFNHWITISGACNTRETVLKRDGTNV